MLVYMLNAYRICPNYSTRKIHSNLEMVSHWSCFIIAYHRFGLNITTCGPHTAWKSRCLTKKKVGRHTPHTSVHAPSHSGLFHRVEVSNFGALSFLLTFGFLLDVLMSNDSLMDPLRDQDHENGSELNSLVSSLTSSSEAMSAISSAVVEALRRTCDDLRRDGQPVPEFLANSAVLGAGGSGRHGAQNAMSYFGGSGTGSADAAFSGGHAQWAAGSLAPPPIPLTPLYPWQYPSP